MRAAYGVTFRCPNNHAATGKTNPRNKRRVEGERGKQLLRRRGEFLERPFAHQYETGGLRRVHVRGRSNVAKRILVQAAAFNLALILRSLTKAGTPRGLADLTVALFCAVCSFWLPSKARYAPLASTSDQFRDEIFAALRNPGPMLQ